MSCERHREIRRRRHRRMKVRKLRQKLEQTTDPEERRRIIEKIRRVAPNAPVPES
jgi:hypothetical protein